MNLLLVKSYPAGLNTGMLSVDMAFLSFLRRARRYIDIDVTFVNPEYSYSFFTHDGLPILSSSAIDPATLNPSDFDAIVFWGDFLHCWRFHEDDLIPRLLKGHQQSTVNSISRMLFLADSRMDVLRRAVLFGGTIYLNTLSDEISEPYQTMVGRLFHNAELVLVRDPISMTRAHRLAHNRADDMLGVDCSLLLNYNDLCQITNCEPIQRIPKNKIGFSFSRTLTLDGTILPRVMEFVNEISMKVSGAPNAEDISWLEPNWGSPPAGLKEKLDNLRSCDLIITDTYHCALNAWREGVPAICIGRGAEHSKGTLDDKKKELFFMMFNLNEFYLYAESFKGDVKNFPYSAEHFIFLCRNARYLASITETIRATAARAEARLLNALMSLSAKASKKVLT